MMHKWKIKPHPMSKYYYEVRIFAKNSDMIDWRNKLYDKLRFFDKKWERKKGPAEAEVVSYINKKNKYFLGVMLFYKGYVGAGIVAHEIGHAVTFYSCSMLPRPSVVFNNPQQNETFCHCLGYMTVRFWQKWYQYVDKK